MKHIVKYTLALFICTLALLGLVACAPSELSYEEQKTAYNGIIEEYTALLTASLNGEELPVPDTKDMDEREAAIAETLYGVVAAGKGGEAAKNMGYGFKDMDGNGTPELLLLSRSTSIRAVFTLSGKKPILLEVNYGSGTTFLFGEDNRFLLMRDTVIDNIEEAEFYTCHVDGDKMVYDAVYGAVYDMEQKEILEYYQMVDGNRTAIDKETYDKLNQEYRNTYHAAYYTAAKLIAPRMIYPLAEQTGNPPPADFSTYDAIKATFKEMVAYMPEAEKKFHTGELDNCFTFDSDAEFETYNLLFYLAYRYSPDKGTFVSAYPENGEKSYGFCEIDLNGDGSDELLLMTDDYRIFSIFTTVKGKVVPVEGYADFAMEWDLKGMDREGRFYGFNIPDYGLGRERAVFAVTADGKLTKTLHLMEVWMSEDDGYFKFENGEKIRLTEEEYNTLRAEQYDKFDMTRDGSGGEIVRNCTDIVFTPFFETPTADHMPADDPWVNLAYGIQDRLYLKAVEKDSTGFIWAEFDGMGEKVGVLVSDTATLTDGKYVFEENGVKGYLEFGVYKVWLVVESSQDERILPRAYLYDFREDD